jgi:hypothetical protein
MTDTHIAKLMWGAYATQAGGKTFDGKPLPSWEELGEERQSCWVAAALRTWPAPVAADRIEKLEAALLDVIDNFFDGARICEIARKALEGKDD